MKIFVDDLGEKITYPCENTEIFENFVTQNFDMNELAISRKLFHTFRVAESCFKIGEDMGLDKWICYTIGLLHDYGRFYQWKQFHSYVDKDTIDHADLSVNLLFNNNEIKKFKVAEKDLDLLKVTIKNHNKKEISIDDLKQYNFPNLELIFKYCQLIRDCDKLDIFNLLNHGVTTFANYEAQGVTPQVVEDLKNHRLVDKRFVKTGADDIFVHVAYLFDLSPSFLKYINLNDFFKNIKTFYVSNLSQKDQTVVCKYLEDMKNYFNKLSNEN